MKLEEAITKLESVNKYRQISYDSLKYWNIRLQPTNEYITKETTNLQNKLRHTLVHHHNTYELVDTLDDWAKSEPPKAKDYGTNAEKLLKIDKKINYLSWINKSSLGLGAISLIITIPAISMPLIMVGAIGMNVNVSLREKTEQLQNEKDASEYIKDLAEYYGRDKYFNRLTMNILDETITNYANSLKILTEDLEKYGGKNKIDDLIDNYIEIQTFKESFEDVIKTIRKSKKNPTPKESEIIKSAITISKIELMENYINKHNENCIKPTSELLKM
jgi:hypothetical protein